MERIIIHVRKGDEYATALLEEGLLCEHHIASDSHPSLLGALFKGRVERFVPGMEAAFVSLGLEKNGFLPLSEAPPQRGAEAPKGLQSGQELLVQVKKEPQGEKGLYLTRNPSLAGSHMVYIPLDPFVGVSRRVSGEERETLLSLSHDLAPESGGLVLRSAALQADLRTLKEELAGLMAQWTAIQEAYPRRNAPCLLHNALTPFQELLRDYGGNISRIITNVPNLWEPAIEEHHIPLEYCPDDDPWAMYDIPARLEKATGRKVWLKSGGTLVIDPCEAMTVIDVNTGKYTGRKALSHTVLKTNLEACGEIARQMRLRNMGGIILIDFIDMKEEAHREMVQAALAEALKTDRVKTSLHGFTSLGLMEVTRKKKG